jgi:hypothetical protein
MTSATGVPVSTCFSAKEICSSVNLLFFTAPLLPSGSHKTGKLVFRPEEKNGKTSKCKQIGIGGNGNSSVHMAKQKARRGQSVGGQ